MRRDELTAGLVRLAVIAGLGLAAIAMIAAVLIVAGGARPAGAFGAAFGGAGALLLLAGAAVGLGTGATRGERSGGMRIPHKTTPQERRDSAFLAGGLLAAGAVCTVVALVLG